MRTRDFIIGRATSRPRARPFSASVPLTTGLLTTVSSFGLLAPVTFAKVTAGSSANLSINASTGGISAAAALNAGETQVLNGTATGADGVVLPFTANLTGIGQYVPPPTITSSDGEAVSLVSDGPDNYNVTVAGSVIGTVTKAQIDAGGWITVKSPVTGMSGNNVVLTSPGYMVYVGNTVIETDVEIYADTAIVGNSLPFDASAYPDAELTVRFKYSVGSSNTYVSSTARLAPLKIIQFRDTILNLGYSGPAYPSALRTRKMTIALRITGSLNSTGTPTTIKTVFIDGARLQANGNGTATLQSASVTPSTQLGTAVTLPTGDNQDISLMIAIDYDGGLPGGETFCVWWSRNGAPWSKLTGQIAPPPDGRLAWLSWMGSVNSITVGGNFDVHNHLWIANQALDPATNYSQFFNADGTVKRLPINGVVAGVTPVIYAVGNDFVTGANRGLGGSFGVLRTLPVVVNV